MIWKWLERKELKNKRKEKKKKRDRPGQPRAAPLIAWPRPRARPSCCPTRADLPSPLTHWQLDLATSLTDRLDPRVGFLLFPSFFPGRARPGLHRRRPRPNPDFSGIRSPWVLFKHCGANRDSLFHLLHRGGPSNPCLARFGSRRTCPQGAAVVNALCCRSGEFESWPSFTTLPRRLQAPSFFLSCSDSIAYGHRCAQEVRVRHITKPVVLELSLPLKRREFALT